MAKMTTHGSGACHWVCFLINFGRVFWRFFLNFWLPIPPSNWSHPPSEPPSNWFGRVGWRAVRYRRSLRRVRGVCWVIHFFGVTPIYKLCFFSDENFGPSLREVRRVSFFEILGMVGRHSIQNFIPFKILFHSKVLAVHKKTSAESCTKTRHIQWHAPGRSLAIIFTIWYCGQNVLPCWHYVSRFWSCGSIVLIDCWLKFNWKHMLPFNFNFPRCGRGPDDFKQ